MRKLTEAECRYAMEHGEFDKPLISFPAAAIILTQSWCPQWTMVKGWLAEAEKRLEAAYPQGFSICYIEYDIAEWNGLSSESFMEFKENHFGNQEIPYIRYYRDGVFVRDSNFINLQGFLARLGLDA
jgi:hypothetical protein